MGTQEWFFVVGAVVLFGVTFYLTDRDDRAGHLLTLGDHMWFVFGYAGVFILPIFSVWYTHALISDDAGLSWVIPAVAVTALLTLFSVWFLCTAWVKQSRGIARKLSREQG